MMTPFDLVIVGAGVSGLAAAKCARQAGLNIALFELTDQLGGLWHCRPHHNGVMHFTHINVSKYNYCFSDFPFPPETPDFPHHTQVLAYLQAFCDVHDLKRCIHFKHQLHLLENVRETCGFEWMLTFHGVNWNDEAKKWERTLKKEEIKIAAHNVALCTGHHAKPQPVHVPGLNMFKGRVLHSVHFKHVDDEKITGRVLVLGIGNSGVDVAVNCANSREVKPPVLLSSRHGAWIFPNYIFGTPADLYACRLLLKLPWRLVNFIMETMLCLTTGHPNKWHLNPQFKALQSHPTVSPTLIHHIQRNQILPCGQIVKLRSNSVLLKETPDRHTIGKQGEPSSRVRVREYGVDCIILCTGYQVHLPFLSDDLRQQVLSGPDDASNELNLFRDVFTVQHGHTLAFIGFVQPASGGIIGMSEMQARWQIALIQGNAKRQLPSSEKMKTAIAVERANATSRYVISPRHTFQRDPLLYMDSLAKEIGVEPSVWRWPWLAWRFMLSSCGPAQYRLQGMHSWADAAVAIQATPIPQVTLLTMACVSLFGISVAILVCCMYFLPALR